mmetsp:Transcript_20895/g.51824  ORF Transcript_20895/g.51824 Transcript_20895/m.51824 type:complete len:265 (-) Transcript_20895:318-1112(-)|eukprot:CAMPEP_0116084048 /NCGR_PEP_ID=MMETSP0327-20121206/3596_1 /TAXON_ID=44447 /ORGANISM="Pseudo-nitzschia delicatissima, Strain B596" /LENGTH=264 /DNA_ID=CAMNT_0003574971 /DNA_START=71 /DNA_END=865 /DNA_ORIENTATION=-
MKSYTLVAYHSAFVALISLMVATRAVKTTAFVVPSFLPGAVVSKTATSTALSMAETEVEKLLRMARELRAQAEESEKQVSEKIADKKADKEVRLGGLLNHLFYDGTKGHDVGTPDTAINALSSVVSKLRSKNPSVDTLEQFVDWVDERRDIALGNEHVESKGGGGYAAVKSKKDLAEAERLNMLIDTLLDALQVIDNDKDQNQKHEKGHLGSGHTSDDLRRRLRENRRERDEQFLERQQSIVEAQTIKEKSKYEFHDEFLDDRD